MKIFWSLILATLMMVTSCSGKHGLSGSSEPINSAEKVAYKQALLRCAKTGGTRVVKIHGKLRCF